MATWNAAFNASPAGGDNPKFGDDKIRELKTTLVDRWIKEHHFDINEGGAQPRQGLHKAGSAVAFYQDTAPTQRNGVALAAADAGLIWVNSATKLTSVWSGTAFVAFPNALTEVRITTGSGNWTVPDGVYRIRVKCIGGGGGGGGGYAAASQTGGGGGGGGTNIAAVPWSIINTTPGSSIAYSVGSGGSGGTNLGTNGSDGTQTTFVGATTGAPGSGGIGGALASDNAGQGGAGATGGYGVPGTPATLWGSISGASYALGGTGGGCGGYSPGTALNGTTGGFGGGGGGGGGTEGSGKFTAGGAGGSGIIIIEYLNG